MVHKIKGFADICFPESNTYTFLEAEARKVFSSYMYSEIRTPIVEFTELFSRSLGDTTDIIQKEMYTFPDKKQRSLTLRPEATAGIVRAYIESGTQELFKVFTFGAMFRYERPQKGRMRQFHQINCECIGTAEPTADAEIITMLMQFLETIGIRNIALLLNSLGCRECRPTYKKVLLDFLHSKDTTKLCEICRERMEKNPLRVLDCKVVECIEYTNDAPVFAEHLCSACHSHFTVVKQLLDDFGIEYTYSSRLVRGLDYYSRTTFEVVSNNIGAQSAIAGGGRYDGLVKQLGGKDIAGIGFACGIERLLLLIQPAQKERIEYYIAPLYEKSLLLGHKLAKNIRAHNKNVECAYTVTSIKHAMKYAGKQAKYCILLGEEEYNNTTCSVKNMDTGVQETYPLDTFLNSLHV